jgi:hypothetical protein
MDLAWRQIPTMAEKITKPVFQKQHYDAIAELVGQKIVYRFMDEKDYSVIEAFAEMFAQDNPATFDKHSRKKNNKEDNRSSVSDQ